LGKTLEKMAQEELHSTLTLKGLVSEDIKAFAEAKLQGPISDELIDAICVRCEGNPLFARELINSGRHDKTIVLSEELWCLQTGAGLASASVEELIARRLHALSPTCFYTLDIAACLGREFHLRNLAIVYGNEKIAREAIAPLAAAGVLLVDANNVRFEHALVHETAYNMAGKRRHAHHRHIAESLESEYLGSQDYFLYDVAHHYGRSDIAEKSFKYNGMAGDKAASEHAVERAAAFYDVALAAMATTPVGGKHYEERLAMLERLGDICALGGMCDRALEAFEAGEREHHEGEAKARFLRKVASVHEMKGEYETSLDILAGIKTLADGKSAELGRARLEEGFVRYRKGEYEKALALYSEAIKMFEEFGGEQKDFSEAFRAVGNIHWSKVEYDDALRYYEKSLAVMEEIGEQYGIAAALNNIGVVHAEKGELDVALVFYGRSLEIREKIGDKQGIALSLNNIGALYYNGGELGRALEFYARSLTIVEKMGDKHGIPMALNNIGVVHAENGELDVALEFYVRSLEIREKIGDKQGIAMSLNNIGVMHYWKGELDRALEFYERSLEINEKIEDKYGIAMSLNTIGVVHHDRIYMNKALESYERSLMICLEIGERRLAVPNYCGIAEVNIETRNNEAGFENAKKAIEVAVEIGAKSEEGMSHRMLGMVYRAKKEWDKANEEFEMAKRILGKVGDKKELARALYEHARFYRDMGDLPKAKEHLDKALAEFERMGMKLWIEKCRKAIE
jgi:tetratricopeptide (TPR) repeat protein